MCAVGPHATGTPTDLCPTYSSKEGRYIVDNWFSATNYIGAFSPGSDIENNWAAGGHLDYLLIQSAQQAPGV